MTYEKVKINVGDEQFDVIHCKGDGQCKCKSCEEKGKWNVSWTSWFYKLSENDEGVMCRDCLTEILVQKRIDKTRKGTAKEIFQDLINCCALYGYVTREYVLEQVEKYGLEVEE